MDREIKTIRSAWPAAGNPAEPQPPVTREVVPLPAQADLPIPRSLPIPASARSIRLVLALAVLAGAALGGIYWWGHAPAPLPPGISSGNGRLESDQIDIDTKFAGRVAEILADEGYTVKAGQIVARMDTKDLEASLEKSQAQVRQAQKAIDEANANIAQQDSQLLLAQQEMDRAADLVKRGFETKEVYDQRRQALDSAGAALKAAQARMAEAQHAHEAAVHDVELYTVDIADNALVAPRNGRIEYRIVNVGEVLPAGGKVFTMLDTSNVYMDIFLPTEVAGRIKVGADARIVLDAYPNAIISARVAFVAAQAQFTPKTVETASERLKLMFRIRLRVDPGWLQAHGETVGGGLPGVGYVRTDATTVWPDRLRGGAGP